VSPRRSEPDRQHAPDGSPVGLYLAIGTMGEPELIRSVIPAGAEVLDLGAGVGRIAHALVALGHPVTAVDDSPEMLRHVRGARTVLSKIEDLDLGRRFDCVLLMSNLVNAAKAATRRGLLRACRRHVAADGVVLIERYDPKLELAPGTHTGTYGDLRVAVERSGAGRRTCTRLTYEHPDGRIWHQEVWGAPRVLDDDAMRAALAQARLRLARTFGPKRRWCLARPV